VARSPEEHFRWADFFGAQATLAKRHPDLFVDGEGETFILLWQAANVLGTEAAEEESWLIGKDAADVLIGLKQK
jgi:hypothetical protein